MKYVIWGCGKRGKSIASVMGKNLVAVFIDRNDVLHGSLVMGIPVISYGEYLERGNHELVIIAVKGQEKYIGEGLDQDKIPWVAADTIECAGILNQYRQIISSIIKQYSCKGNNIIYGCNIYGLYLYEILKLHGQKCRFILQKNISNNLLAFSERELPVIKQTDLQKEHVEIIYISLEDDSIDLLEESCAKIIKIFKTYEDYTVFCHPELKCYHNIHKNERCFVVATGPSLKMEDLDMLDSKNEICFSMNTIFKAFAQTKWRPDYYFLGDFTHWENYKNNVLQMKVKEKFIPDSIIGADDYGIEASVKIFHDLCENNFESRELKFSEDFSVGAYSAATIVYSILQLAVYMGCFEIYLLGVDFNYVYGGKNNHFNSENKADFEDHCVEEMLLAYHSARKYADTHGIKIFNATRGGKLEVFERVNFDLLFE